MGIHLGETKEAQICILVAVAKAKMRLIEEEQELSYLRRVFVGEFHSQFVFTMLPKRTRLQGIQTYNNKLLWTPTRRTFHHLAGNPTLPLHQIG